MAAAFLARSDTALSYRAAVFVPFFVAAYGVLAAFYETCSVRAISGCRLTSEGTEPVADRAELAAQRKTGLRVLGMSGALAGLATALFVVAS